jgi:ABC-2 type transport system permease protein
LTESETGVLRRLLAAPIPRGAIIAGKMIAYMVIACLQVVILLGLAHAVFDTPLGRSPTALVVLTVVVAFTATALGMLVAALARTAKQADNTGMILGFLLAGLGGAIPVSPTMMFTRTGGFMSIVARLTPHGHAVEAYYRIMAEKGTFTQVLPEIGILLVMGVGFFLVARWRFRFE